MKNQSLFLILLFSILAAPAFAQDDVYYPDYGNIGGGGGSVCSTCDIGYANTATCTGHYDASFGYCYGTCQAEWESGITGCVAHNIGPQYQGPVYCTKTGSCEYIAYWYSVAQKIGGSTRADRYKAYGDAILHFMKDAKSRDGSPMLPDSDRFEEQASLAAAGASVELGEQARATMIFEKFNEVVIGLGGTPLKVGEVPKRPQIPGRRPSTSVAAFDE